MILINLAAAGIFARDKRLARQGRERIPERTLHLLEALGGCFAILPLMYLIHHKNRKQNRSQKSPNRNTGRPNNNKFVTFTEPPKRNHRRNHHHKRKYHFKRSGELCNCHLHNKPGINIRSVGSTAQQLNNLKHQHNTHNHKQHGQKINNNLFY